MRNRNRQTPDSSHEILSMLGGVILFGYIFYVAIGGILEFLLDPERQNTDAQLCVSIFVFIYTLVVVAPRLLVWLVNRFWRDEEINIHPLALEAIQRAQQNPVKLRVIPADMGLMAYVMPDSSPVICREVTRLPEDTHFIRPYIVFRKRRGQLKHKIRFELVDGDEIQLFVEEAEGVLKAGDTFVHTNTWLPLAKVGAIDSAWELHLYLDDVLIAAHNLTWDAGGGPILAHLTGDGEISDELLDIVSDPELDRVSLDELLGG